MSQASTSYRGHLAPSPTGLLHIGHARTFWIAAQRIKRHGTLILRNEDLDPQVHLRSRPR
ncbi:MAG TPA: glutamate--tRNA ligase family protein [Terriglobales bacterium]